MTELKRCEWVKNNSLYQKYHDEEWGVPIHEDNKHFEFLILEGAQAGLSWETILRKREGYKVAFKGFDPLKVASMTDIELNEQVKNTEIVRNKLKIFSARKNAQVFLEIQKEFDSFDNYIWSFVEGKTIIGNWKNIKEVPAKTLQSDAISKDLKKRGMSFVGSTIIYAYMQATGLVNDHTTDCLSYKNLLKG